jgi:hypothetical protein
MQERYNIEVIKVGWWKLEAWKDNGKELSDTDKEHIAQAIKEGYTNGEVIDD